MGCDRFFALPRGSVLEGRFNEIFIRPVSQEGMRLSCSSAGRLWPAPLIAEPASKKKDLYAPAPPPATVLVVTPSSLRLHFEVWIVRIALGQRKAIHRLAKAHDEIISRYFGRPEQANERTPSAWNNAASCAPVTGVRRKKSRCRRAHLTFTIALMMASATSLRAAALRQAFGSHAMWTCGISIRAREPVHAARKNHTCS